MSSKKEKVNKNLILFVGNVPANAISGVKKFEKDHKKKFRIALIKDIKSDAKINDGVDVLISCDMSSFDSRKEALDIYRSDFVAVTCRGEKNIPGLQRVIENLPELNNPQVKSLTWATNKIQMRRKLSAYDKKISPTYTIVHDAKKSTIKNIKDKIGFPLVVKPAGLASSLLVSICFYPEELELVLKKTFSKIEKIYKEVEGRGDPEVLVESFMDGEIYSTDAYVSAKGELYFTPFVHAKNGRSIGFDDFFEYKLVTPTYLNEKSINDAKDISKKAIKALELSSTVAHIELVKTEDGWRVIEVGPRIGGWRNAMYELSFGINHSMNEVLVKMGKVPIVPKKTIGYTAVLQFYPRKEGVLKKVSGIKKSKELKSFNAIKINKKIGDKIVFAKHGGKPVFNITLSNKDKSDLFGDVRRLEQMIVIETK